MQLELCMPQESQKDILHSKTKLYLYILFIKLLERSFEYYVRQDACLCNKCLTIR